MSKVIVPLTTDERVALVKLALLEVRNPADEARHIIRAELLRRGLLVQAQAVDVVEMEAGNDRASA